jgi:hypothetical protein
MRRSPNSRQAPKSAQTWLPKTCGSALDEIPKPYYCGSSNHTSAPSLPRLPCLALHPCALPVHPPPTTAKASALASLMSGVASRPNRVRPVRPLDEAVLTTREIPLHQPEATPSQRTRTPVANGTSANTSRLSPDRWSKTAPIEARCSN